MNIATLKTQNFIESKLNGYATVNLLIIGNYINSTAVSDFIFIVQKETYVIIYSVKCAEKNNSLVPK